MFPNTEKYNSFPTLEFGPDFGVGACFIRVGLDVKASFLLFLGVNVGRRLGSKGKKEG